MIKFRQKEYSFSSVINDTFKGAGIGSLIGGGTTFFKKGGVKNLAKESQKPFIYGTLVGASLGLAYGLVKDVDRKINRKTTIDRRFFRDVVDVLKKDGFKEGEHFTLDKKKANLLKTKVCLVVSNESGELNVIINTISDNKLRGLTDNIIKNLPSMSVINSKFTDKFNEITISTIDGCDRSTIGLLVGIIENYLHSGYPVYMVEVG